MQNVIDIHEAISDTFVRRILNRLATTPDPDQPSLFDLHIPADVLGATVIVAKSFHWYSIPWNYGNHFRVLVAIGGLRSSEFGILKANYTFVTLVIAADLELITHDVIGDVYK